MTTGHQSTNAYWTPSEPQTEYREVLPTLVGRKIHIYQCVSLVGAGAMGQVYLAMHNELQRQCALKVLAPKRGTLDQQYVARFHQEGQAAAALVHPNVVTLHAIGRIADTHFLEMEYVPGKSLARLIRDEGPLPSDWALRLATMIADGLAAAHRAGIVHRDVKPDNILITRDGIAKIGDFGLAKRIKTDSDESDRIICGTPNYMAPEVLLGAPATPASDVYALGLCIFEMLIGNLPWRETSAVALTRFGREEAIPDIRDLRPELSADIAECVRLLTDSSLTHRPATAALASQLLRELTGQERDIESLLIEAFSHEPTVTWQHNGNRYEVLQSLPNGRHQTVFVEHTEPTADDKLLLIYSVCCPAQAGFYEQALRQNSIVMHGSLAIRDIDGQAMFVVLNAYPRSTVSPEEVRRSVLDIAAQADRVEKKLTGLDVN